MLTFYWPVSPGEWLGFVAAALSLGLGLLALVSPRAAFWMTRLQPKPNSSDAVAEARATLAGPFIALGGGFILLAQPLIALVLGAAWALTAFGRLVSMVADRSFSRFNLLAMLFEALVATAALAAPLGYVA
jgi:hypothetical protein